MVSGSIGSRAPRASLPLPPASRCHTKNNDSVHAMLESALRKLVPRGQGLPGCCEQVSCTISTSGV